MRVFPHNNYAIPSYSTPSTIRCIFADSLNLWQAVCVWDRQSVTDTVCNIQFVFYYRLSVSVTDRLCLSQSVCVCYRLSVSVTGSLCLKHTVCVCHRQSMSVTDNLCRSQAVCVWHRHSSSSFSAWFSLIYPWFSPRSVREIWISPAFKHHQHQLCGPLGIVSPHWPKSGCAMCR